MTTQAKARLAVGLMVAGVVGFTAALFSLSEWRGHVDEALDHISEDLQREREVTDTRFKDIQAILVRIEAKVDQR